VEKHLIKAFKEFSKPLSIMTMTQNVQENRDKQNNNKKGQTEPSLGFTT